MPTRYPAPNEQTVQSTLNALGSVATEVTRAPAKNPDPNQPGVFVKFVNSSREIGVVVYADHEAVNFVGGAHAGVELAALQASNEQGALNDDGLQGFREVADGLVACLNSDYTPQLEVHSVEPASDSNDAGLAQMLQEPSGRRAFTVSANEYGAGTITLFFS